MSRNDDKGEASQSFSPRKRIAARVLLEPGDPPGTLRPMAGSPPPVVTTLRIDQGKPAAVQPVQTLSHLPEASSRGVVWVRVTGLGDVEPIRTIADFYHIRRLAMEDTLNPGWRTKLEQQGDFAFLVIQAPPPPDKRGKGEHLSLFCKPGLVITFEDTHTRLVDSLWERLQKDNVAGRFTHGAEFLMYTVLDLTMDEFFPHLDRKDEALDELEQSISGHVPKLEELNRLHQVKRDLITLRRLLTPFKELRQDLPKLLSDGAVKELRPYLNDLDDHIVQVGELLDTYYEVAKSLDEISQSALSNRMNDIMKLLTIISTVFMPLSFIAGVYGMNFDTKYPLNMPELSWPFGYVLVLFVMACIAGTMIWFFKRKGWL